MVMKRYNGGGTVYKVGGNTNRRKKWRVRVTAGWTDDGKQIIKDLGYFTTRKEAEKHLKEFKNNEHYNIDLYNITLAEVYAKWSEEHKRKIEKDSFRHHSGMFKNHLTPLHNMAMSDIRRQAILKMLTGKTPNQQKRALITLRYLFEWAIANDVNVKVNYAAGIKPGDAETIEGQTIDREIYSVDEVKELWKHEGKQLYDITLILLYTGLRINELLLLKMEDIHLDKDYMIGGLKTEDGKRRTIPIHPKIKHIIERYYSPDKSVLFYNTKNRPLSYKSCREHWKKLPHFKDRTLHETRHTFISRLANQNINITKIQRIIGHKGIKRAIDVYIHTDIQDLLNVVSKMDY